MRILALTNMYPPHHFGGYELACKDVLDLFREGGHEVHVLTSDVRLPKASRSQDEPQHNIRRELRIYLDGHRLLKPPIKERLAIERANQEALGKALRETNPEVVSVWNMGAMSFGLLSTVVFHGVPAVLVVGDDWLVFGPRVDPWSKLFLRHRLIGRLVTHLTGVPTILRELDKTVACFASEALRRRAKRSSRLKFDRQELIPHGANLADFPHPSSSELRTSWEWRLLYVGRVEERKGIHTAVEALACLPHEARLTIVGRGDDYYKARLEQLAVKLRVRDQISFDEAERRELRRHYLANDVLVFPSIWDEPFGIVPLEAMACGLPVVATGTGGSGEYLQHAVNSLLYKRGDESGLAKAIEKLSLDPSLRMNLRDQGFSTAERFDIRRTAEQLERIHLEAIARI